MSDVNWTATSEQGWRRKEQTTHHKQSTQAKQLTARNKNALARDTTRKSWVLCTQRKTCIDKSELLNLWQSTHQAMGVSADYVSFICVYTVK